MNSPSPKSYCQVTSIFCQKQPHFLLTCTLIHIHTHFHPPHVHTLRHGCKFCSPLCVCTAGCGDSNSSQSACASIVYEFSNRARPTLLASPALGLPEAQTTILTQRMFPSSMTNMPWCLVFSESATQKCQRPHEAVKLFRKLAPRKDGGPGEAASS